MIGIGSFPIVYLYFWIKHRSKNEKGSASLATSRFKTIKEISKEYPSAILERLEIAPKELNKKPGKKVVK